MQQRPEVNPSAPRPPVRRSASEKAPKQRPPTPPPTIFDKQNSISYVRGQLLGEVSAYSLIQGGFAKCFQVQEGNRQLAAKVVWKPSLKSGKQRQKLLSEIQIHQALSHPNIVSIECVFEDDENVYLIMELCTNRTFVDLIKKRKRLTDEECRFWMWQLLDGIRYMHRKGYIHRDIKLGNLFLDSKMNLKIGDFGLAAQIDHDGARKKTICGTPNYIAPEILFDTKNGHSFEVDIWSLGVVMYTLLIGKPPFQTKEVKTIYKNIRDNLYDFPENIPIVKEARLIITAFLSPKPDERPSVDDVMEHTYFQQRPNAIPLSALNEIPDLGQNILTNLVNKAAVNNWRSPGRPGVKDKPVPLIPSNPSPGITTRSRPQSTQAIPISSTMPPRSPLPLQPARNSIQTTKSPLSVNTYTSPRPSSNSRPIPLNTRSNNSLSTPQAKKSESSQKSSSWVSSSSNPGTPREQNENQSPSARYFKDISGKERLQSPVKASSRKLSSLEEIFNVLNEGLTGKPILSLQHQMDQLGSEEIAHPTVFITKWIDYTNKYGLSYQLRDGSVGVYFNDTTSIILASDGEHFEYLYYDRSGERPVMHRRVHNLNSPPPDLSKKITLLKHFKGYMQDNLTKAYSDSSQSGSAQTLRLDFLTKYLRTKSGVLFRLSNQSLQLNLFDHTKLIITQGGKIVTFIGKTREMETRSLSYWVATKNEEVLERLGYCKDIVQQLLSPKA